MPEKNSIEKIIHRIALCRTSQAKQLLCDFFKILQFDSEIFDKIKNVILRIKYPHWHNFYDFIDRMLEDKTILKSDAFSDYFDNIKIAIKKRMKYEDEISHILPLAQRKYGNHSGLRMMRHHI